VSSNGATAMMRRGHPLLHVVWKTGRGQFVLTVGPAAVRAFVAVLSVITALALVGAGAVTPAQLTDLIRAAWP
jgi:hypothetical protein